MKNCCILNGRVFIMERLGKHTLEHLSSKVEDMKKAHLKGGEGKMKVIRRFFGGRFLSDTKYLVTSLHLVPCAELG